MDITLATQHVHSTRISCSKYFCRVVDNRTEIFNIIRSGISSILDNEIISRSIGVWSSETRQRNVAELVIRDWRRLEEELIALGFDVIHRFSEVGSQTLSS
jgi:hypothetical protein